MTIIFASNLPENIFNEVKQDYFTRIEQAGIYNETEIEEFMAELGDQYIHDLQDAIDPMLWAYCVDISNGLALDTLPTLYKRYDLQDESNYEYCTFAQAKEWLADFWSYNPDEDATDAEHDDHIRRILLTDDLNELDDMLQGIDHAIEEAF